MTLHRGRFQAQGIKLEESENWAQELPLKTIDAKKLLTALKSKISIKDAKKRKVAFDKCHEFIDRAHLYGGVDVQTSGKPLIKSFPRSSIERVDLEVNSGIAFIK